MIDLHSHLLPGLDDGARTLDEAVSLAREMEADGVRVVAATPHVRDDYPTTADQMEAGLARVQEAVADAGLALKILPGGELALARLGTLALVELERFGLGGNAGLLLVEFPYDGWPPELAAECLRLSDAGIVPVLAHPERNLVVQSRPADVEALVRAGALVQLTAASVDGRLGRSTAACARRLLELGLAHMIASDAHGPGVREAGLSAAAQAVGEPLGTWLTEDVPAALLAGEEPPRRPAAPRRTTWRDRLRR